MWEGVRRRCEKAHDSGVAQLWFGSGVGSGVIGVIGSNRCEQGGVVGDVFFLLCCCRNNAA